jgi:predicted glycosyltransferase involved in capsule biosynthesis
MNEKVLQELREKLTVKNRWYHKIPYIGKKIYSKQQYKLFQSQKSNVFSMIIKEADELAKKNIDNYFDHFADINAIDLGESTKFMTIKNRNVEKYEKICKGVKL